jgi:hypothetical protein
MRLTMGYNKGGPVRVWSLCMDCNVHSMAGPSDQWEGCTQNEHTYSINNIYIYTHIHNTTILSICSWIKGIVQSQYLVCNKFNGLTCLDDTIPLIGMITTLQHYSSCNGKSG